MDGKDIVVIICRKIIPKDMTLFCAEKSFIIISQWWIHGTFKVQGFFSYGDVWMEICTRIWKVSL
jgi:hypothetical protein